MQRWVITIGLSVAATAVVAEALLLIGWYTGLRTVVLLAVVACAGAVIGRLRVPGRRDAGRRTETTASVTPIEMSKS